MENGTKLFILDNFAAKEKKTVPLQWVKDAPEISS